MNEWMNELLKIFIHHNNGSIIHNRKKVVKNLSKQSDYDNKISVTEWQSNTKDSD